MARSATPPLFDLGDPAFRVQQRADGLHIERRFRLRAMMAPLGVGTVLVLVTWSAWQDEAWWAVAALGAGLFLWVVFVLVRIGTHDCLHFGPREITWSQRWPRAWTGSWPRGAVKNVRLVYDRSPRWHDNLHVRVDVQCYGDWVQLAFATTLGMAPARRRAERLADTIGEVLGRHVERIVEAGP